MNVKLARDCSSLRQGEIALTEFMVIRITSHLLKMRHTDFVYDMVDNFSWIWALMTELVSD